MDNLPTSEQVKSLDTIQRFIFNDYDIRGEIVQTNEAYKDILSEHKYPLCIQKLLGEMQVAICLITATLKFKGSIMLQIRSKNQLKYAIVNSNDKQETRGLASFDGEIEDNRSFNDLVGIGGIMSITVIPDEGQQYQGTIALDKSSLSECLEEYYRQSMQIQTKIILFSACELKIAAGLLLQVLPSNNQAKQDEDFNHVCTLADTITAAEIMSIDSQDVIYRLFNQESVNIFPNEQVCFKCICSKEHFSEMLTHLNQDELLKILNEDGFIETECHCCGKKYTFNNEEIISIIKKAKGHL